jgi:hypothetical protein
MFLKHMKLTLWGTIIRRRMEKCLSMRLSRCADSHLYFERLVFDLLQQRVRSDFIEEWVAEEHRRGWQAGHVPVEHALGKRENVARNSGQKVANASRTAADPGRRVAPVACKYNSCLVVKLRGVHVQRPSFKFQSRFVE